MEFAALIADWQARHGRHRLPWQNTRDPYRIWLSEIMLQQTQVATVIPYFERFLGRFPDVAALAAASQEDVMPYWAGLGYYARARNLHRCAQDIVARWAGRFPPDAQTIATLPGIGRSTAAAIAAFAYGERSPIMDGNVKRVFTRHFGIEGDPSKRELEQRLWRLAEDLVSAVPGLDMTAYTQGLMDLGATLCTRGKPACDRCPVAASCIARRDGRQQELPTPRHAEPCPSGKPPCWC
ncbi:A/G-specific adenine glycosylase [Bordetella holmesii 70147]|nr:A/G-specific adenine glycosylase [Bordetella holmesii 70147]